VSWASPPAGIHWLCWLYWVGLTAGTTTFGIAVAVAVLGTAGAMAATTVRQA
jgi:hypothetical protein